MNERKRFGSVFLFIMKKTKKTAAKQEINKDRLPVRSRANTESARTKRFKKIFLFSTILITENPTEIEIMKAAFPGYLPMPE